MIDAMVGCAKPHLEVAFGLRGLEMLSSRRKAALPTASKQLQSFAVQYHPRKALTYKPAETCEKNKEFILKFILGVV